jgi:hypothetical protein
MRRQRYGGSGDRVRAVGYVQPPSQKDSRLIQNQIHDAIQLRVSLCAARREQADNDTGLAILDTSVSPNNAIIGVSNSVAGYILTQKLPKQ